MRRREVRRRDVLAGGAALIAAPAVVPRAAAATGASVKRAVLITGCSSGFGRLAAETLAARGHAVAASMRRTAGANAGERDALLATAETNGWDLSVPEIDVDDPASVERGVAEALERHGRIDALVSNAGIGIPAPVEVSVEATERVFRTNLFGALHAARAVLPAMRERGEGLIVHVTSGLGRLTLPGIAAYCGSKFAGEAMFEALAYEVAPHGVGVSIVQPGGFSTEFNANARAYHAELMASLDAGTRERAAAYEDIIAFALRLVGDYGQPDPSEVADAIAALVEAPAAERPLRGTVGRSMGGVERINEAVAGVQEGVMRGNGLGDRLPPGRS